MPRRIVHGVHRFRSTVFTEERALYERLAKGQSPETLFITCSDSRIVTDELTQTGPGDMFVLRNAGNIVPAHGCGGGEAASIEYAVVALGVKDIIVCGHTQCGAVKGILAPESLASMPVVAQWLEHGAAVRSIIEESYGDLAGDARHEAAVEENVLVQIEHLQTHPAVAARLHSGKLALHAWVFDLKTGGVRTYDAEIGKFTALREDSPEVPSRRAAE